MTLITLTSLMQGVGKIEIFLKQLKQKFQSKRFNNVPNVFAHQSFANNAGIRAQSVKFFVQDISVVSGSWSKENSISARVLLDKGSLTSLVRNQLAEKA